jgi:hypothetical protein
MAVRATLVDDHTMLFREGLVLASSLPMKGA